MSLALGWPSTIPDQQSLEQLRAIMRFDSEPTTKIITVTYFCAKLEASSGYKQINIAMRRLQSQQLPNIDFTDRHSFDQCRAGKGA